MALSLNDSDNLNGCKIFGCFKLRQTKSFGQKVSDMVLCRNFFYPKLFEINVWYLNSSKYIRHGYTSILFVFSKECKWVWMQSSAFKILTEILFLCFIFTLVMCKKILSTTASLIRLARQTRKYDASSSNEFSFIWISYSNTLD